MFDFDFENKITSQGIHYSRYIASWLKAMGFNRGPYRKMFKEWLETQGLTEGEEKDIVDMLTNGKMELEYSAEKFLLKDQA